MRNHSLLALSAALSTLSLAAPAAAQSGPGQLHTLTNEASGNRVAVYDRGADGALTFDEFVATGGNGTDGRFFYVLNVLDGTIGDYVVGADGSLTGIPGSASPAPGMRATGLAVR